MEKSVDDVLKDIGQLGRFQISRLAMFCLIIFPPTFQVLNMFFIAAEAPWQCVENSTSCVLNGTFVAGDDDYDFRCKLNRSDWEYATYEGPRSSIISEFDLVCDDAFYGWLAKAMMYVGAAVATIPLGMLSDRFGRRIPLFPCCIIMIVVGFASSFATAYWQVLVSRFLIGPGVFSVALSMLILSAEFVGPDSRPFAQTVMWIFSTVALLCMTLIAYYVRHWRTLMIICSAPWIIVVAFWKFIPESARWYMTHNKVEKAEKVLRKIAEVNKKKYPNVRLAAPPSDARPLGFLALFSKCNLAVSTLIQAFAWFIAGVVFYGASFGASDLGGSMYFNFFLVSLIEIPANILVIDNCKRFGRKKTTVMSMILGGAACFVVSLIPAETGRTDYMVGRVIGGILGKGFITVSRGAFYVWSAEIFPTVVRNSGLAFLSVISNLGSVTAPFVVEAKRIHQTVPFGIMGGLAVIAALFCLVLPETEGKPTQETFELEEKGEARTKAVAESDDGKDAIEGFNGIVNEVEINDTVLDSPGEKAVVKSNDSKDASKGSNGVINVVEVKDALLDSLGEKAVVKSDGGAQDATEGSIGISNMVEVTDT